MNTQKDILQVESLIKTYGKGANQTEALKGISFRVMEGEFLGIMGASGSGKTTLLNCIATMLKPTSGKIILRGQDISGFRGGKVAIYSSLATKGTFGTTMQEALGKNVSIGIDGKDYAILPTLYYDNIVADRAITLYLGLIVPDEMYSTLANEPKPYCRNVRISDAEVEKSGLMQAIQKMGILLGASGIEYDSYLGWIGRNLFNTVAASYLTIYLGILFWLIANTVIGMKYLIGQRRTKHRYKTLTMLGADMPSIRRSIRKQIHTYFLLVLVTALVNGTAAVFSMFTSFAKLPMGVSMEKTILLSLVALSAFAGFDIKSRVDTVPIRRIGINLARKR